MNHLARRASLFVAHIALSLFIGRYIAQAYVSDTSGLMPGIVDRALVAFVTLVGHEELDNADDMYILACMLYWAVAALAVWVVIGAAWLLLRRHRRAAGEVR